MPRGGRVRFHMEIIADHDRCQIRTAGPSEKVVVVYQLFLCNIRGTQPAAAGPRYSSLQELARWSWNAADQGQTRLLGSQAAVDNSKEFNRSRCKSDLAFMIPCDLAEAEDES